MVLKCINNLALKKKKAVLKSHEQIIAEVPFLARMIFSET